MKFLKGLGLGIVYALISPLILVGCVLFAIYGLERWFVSMAIGIIRFFKGDKFFKPLKEDEEVQIAIKNYHDSLLAKETEEPQQPVQSINNTATYVQNNYYTNPNPQMGPLFPQQPALGMPNQAQLNNPQYQQIPTAPIQQIPATPIQQIPVQEVEENGEYSESSIDNPIDLSGEGGNEQ